VELLVRALAAPQTGVAVEAARALGIIGDSRSAKALLAACLRGLPPLSEAAGKALRRIGPPETVVRLTRVLLEGDDRMAAGAEEALVAIGQSAVGPLLKAVRWPYTRARRSAVRALGRIGDVAAIDVLRSVVNDRDRTVREAAVAALQTCGRKIDGG
jgi:HEAT repeat protein